MKATIEIDERSGIEMVEIGNHRIQYGGEGNCFCYAHDSYDCEANLTLEERIAINEAEFINKPINGYVHAEDGGWEQEYAPVNWQLYSWLAIGISLAAMILSALMSL